MDETKNDVDAEKNRELMRQDQQKRDRGATLGPDQRDPCDGEAKSLRNCLQFQRKNAITTCDEFRDYEHNCRQFWHAVQNYRESVLKQSVLKYPQDLDTWRAKMPEFYLTGTLVPPQKLSA